jgi:predicted CXXCH cytochrome family protein
MPTIEESLNDKCISCHQKVYNQAIDSIYLHRPCFERQCIVCHLAPESGWLNQKNGEVAAITTGMPVAGQGYQWQKTMFFASGGPQTIHEAALSGLLETDSFRFRVVLSDSPKPGAGQQLASQWLGLIPAQVQEYSSLPEPVLKINLPAVNFVPVPEIRRLGMIILINWQSRSESYGWVEVQAMDGDDPRQQPTTPPLEQTVTQTIATQEEDSHPLLVDQEFTIIDQCYTCHPEDDLGTSHPVRIYIRGNSTRIPDSLPTGKNGMLTCVTCHDPHGGKSKGLVRELIVTKLCVACHYTYKQTSTSTMF